MDRLQDVSGETEKTSKGSAREGEGLVAAASLNGGWDWLLGDNWDSDVWLDWSVGWLVALGAVDLAGGGDWVDNSALSEGQCGWLGNSVGVGAIGDGGWAWAGGGGLCVGLGGVVDRCWSGGVVGTWVVTGCGSSGGEGSKGDNRVLHLDGC